MKAIKLESVKKKGEAGACEAWPLLVKFFFSQRADLPNLASEFELSAAQCHVLHLIEPDQPIPMGRLADALCCDASNVTGLIDRLESRGLICRQTASGDRRVKVLALTPAGVRLRSTVLERWAKPQARLDRLSPSDQKTLVRILKRLLD